MVILLTVSHVQYFQGSKVEDCDVQIGDLAVGAFEERLAPGASG